MSFSKRLGIGIVGLAVLVVIGALVARKPIGARLFGQAVGQLVGRDSTVGLPDGLHIALCGTGSPLPNPDRAGPCNLVIAGEHLFVVDIGEGGARNLNQMGLPLGRIERVFLTHFHSDHIDGFGPLILGRWTAGTSRTPLPVHGAAGVEQIVAGFNGAYAIDSGYRIRHHGAAIVPPSGAGAMAVAFAAPGATGNNKRVVYQADGVTVTAIKVDHGPVEPAVAYRFDYKGRSLVISGDTKKSATLAAGSKGADLLVHEALQPELVKSMTRGLAAANRPNLAQITTDILNYHASPEEAAEVAAEAGVQELVLSHIVPPMPSRYFYTAFLGDAASRFKGKITVGEDGMLFSLPANSDRILRKRLM